MSTKEDRLWNALISYYKAATNEVPSLWKQLCLAVDTNKMLIQIEHYQNRF